MVKKRSDFSGITTLDGAKNANYNGQSLTDAEKVIFDSPLLKKKNADGTLDNEPDLNNLRDTMALLTNLKVAQAELPKEQTNSGGNLTREGNLLLDSFLNERRINSIAYQVVNTHQNTKQTDKIIKDYQKVMYRRVNKSLEAEKNAAAAALKSIETKWQKQKEEVEKTSNAVDKHLSVKEAKAYRERVRPIVAALKADVAAGQIGRKLLEERVKNFEKVANINFKTSTNYSDSWGSVIKTGVQPSYLDSPYTHPRFLSGGLIFQMREIFQDFDKDKLFALVEKKFATDAAKVQSFKKSFVRIMNASAKAGNIDEERKTWDYWNISESMEERKSRVGGVSGAYYNENPEKAKNKGLFMSDFFRVMDTLFPQSEVATGYVNSPFLTAGDDALPFSGTATLDKNYNFVWRGRSDDNFDGKIYKELVTGGDSQIVKKNYPSKEINLKWAGEKDKSSLPQFFWQVYDKPEAVDFAHSRKYLKKDGITYGEFLKNEFSAYESKLITNNTVFSLPGGVNELLAMSYRDRIKDIIQGKITIAGHDLTVATGSGVAFGDDELTKYWTDFEVLFYGVTKKTTETYHYFKQDAEGVTYDYLKSKNLPITWMMENTKPNLVESELQEIWDKMITKFCEAKINAAKKLSADFGAEIIKLGELNSQRNDALDKLKGIEDKIAKIDNDKIDHLKIQFRTLGEKLKTARPSELKVITAREAASMHNLYSFLKKLEEKHDSADGVFDAFAGTTDITITDDTTTPPTTTTLSYNPQDYMNRLKALEDRWEGVEKGVYGVWKGLGTDFNSRLANWKADAGLNLDEDAVNAYLNSVKVALEGLSTRSLTAEEQSDLDAIKTYLTKAPELREVDVQAAFDILEDINDSLLTKWRTYGDKKLFATNNVKLSEIGEAVNKLDSSQKAIFFTHLKTYLTGKSVPTMPDDSANEQDKLDYFFTLDPQYVIGAIAIYQIKNDSTIKTDTENAMKAAKDSADNTKGLDLTVYGDGTNITEEGTIKYRGEELGGISHSFSSQQGPHQHIPPTTPQKWYEKLGYWPVWGSALLIGALTIAYFKRDNISEWWNGPADEEGDNNEEEGQED